MRPVPGGGRGRPVTSMQVDAMLPWHCSKSTWHDPWIYVLDQVRSRRQSGDVLCSGCLWSCH